MGNCKPWRKDLLQALRRDTRHDLKGPHPAIAMFAPIKTSSPLPISWCQTTLVHGIMSITMKQRFDQASPGSAHRAHSRQPAMPAHSALSPTTAVPPKALTNEAWLNDALKLWCAAPTTPPQS